MEVHAPATQTARDPIGRRPMQFFEDLHDVTLVMRARIGDLAALEVLVQRYRRVLYTVALGILGDAAEAREATRTSLLRAYACLSMHDPDCGFFSLTHRLLVRECLDVARARDAAGDVPAVHGLAFDDRRRCVQQAMLRLDPLVRAILALRHLAGLSYAETAVTLEIPAEAVRSRLHKARQQMGEWLLAWPAGGVLPDDEEALLQAGLDGALDYWEREARERLMQERAGAAVRAAALRELGQLLNSLGPAEPPAELVPEVLSQISARSSSF
jgi:RNA polymerase sigma-70 factor (ECF subfamily)